MIRKYTVRRIDVDYYTISEDELTVTSHGIKWDRICSYGDQFPEYHIPDQAQKRNPRKALRKDDDEYTFYACVDYFPEPRLIGKFNDYTSAYGWDERHS
jgi:hypothetical protein